MIWIRAALFSVAAVAVALLASIAGPYLPARIELKLAAESVGGILTILASSMLAVTTFSLSAMVSAYSAATSTATPHSTKLLVNDPVAQNTLATFIGSFLFSIVGIIGLATRSYGDSGRVILFAATLVVIAIITAALLRWIDHLSSFGRVADTILRVERAAIPAVEQWGHLPRLGARTAIAIPAAARGIVATNSGYVQHIDMTALEKLACAHDLILHIVVLPGTYVHPARPLGFVTGAVDDALRADLAASFSIATDREYDQDPRFGLIVLSEIASRALSPAVNDPGTAIGVLGSGFRVLLAYATAREATTGDRFTRIHAPDLELDELFFSFFNPIARDGAGNVEVHLRLQFALQGLATHRIFATTARHHAQLAVQHTRDAFGTDHESEMLNDRARWATDDDR